MIHQFVPMLHEADAVGRQTVAVQDRLRVRGMASEVFVEIEDPRTSGRTRPASDYPAMARADDVLVYQFATASSMADELAARRERLVVVYHNITPAECFAPWDNALARHQLWGRRQLDGLGPRAVVGVAVSEMNRADLVAAGFARTEVIPPVPEGLDRSLVDAAHPPARRPHGARPLRPAGATWLAVGRLAPNKAIEDTVAALFVYRLRHDPQATLVVVGRPAVGSYAEALRRFVARLGLVDAVTFAGAVDDEALELAYAAADVLVVTSVHEGFCLPVVEAMLRDLPVVALRRGALEEVLGEGGVLLDQAEPDAVSDAVRTVLTDPALRASLAAGASRRLEALGVAGAGDRLVDLLVAVHEGRPLPGPSPSPSTSPSSAVPPPAPAAIGPT